MNKGKRKHWDGPGAWGHCRGCGAEIRWLLTARGRLMPVDSGGVNYEATDFDPALGHVSHFATCAQADMFRKPWAPAQKKKPAGAGS